MPTDTKPMGAATPAQAAAAPAAVPAASMAFNEADFINRHVQQATDAESPEVSQAAGQTPNPPAAEDAASPAHDPAAETNDATGAEAGEDPQEPTPAAGDDSPADDDATNEEPPAADAADGTEDPQRTERLKTAIAKLQLAPAQQTEFNRIVGLIKGAAEAKQGKKVEALTQQLETLTHDLEEARNSAPAPADVPLAHIPNEAKLNESERLWKTTLRTLDTALIRAGRNPEAVAAELAQKGFKVPEGADAEQLETWIVNAKDSFTAALDDVPVRRQWLQDRQKGDEELVTLVPALKSRTNEANQGIERILAKHPFLKSQPHARRLALQLMIGANALHQLAAQAQRPAAAAPAPAPKRMPPAPPRRSVAPSSNGRPAVTAAEEEFKKDPSEANWVNKYLATA